MCEELHAEARRHNQLSRIATKIERRFNAKVGNAQRTRDRQRE